MSNEEFTPTIEQLRAWYVLDSTRNHDEYMTGRSFADERARYGAQFDRALAARDAEVRASMMRASTSIHVRAHDAVESVMGNALSVTLARNTLQRLILHALAGHEVEVRAGVVAAEPSDQVKQLLRDLTDPDDCWFDHHGGCQAHGYLSLQPGEKCPHAEAKELLAAWVPVKQQGEKQ